MLGAEDAVGRRWCFFSPANVFSLMVFLFCLVCWEWVRYLEAVVNTVLVVSVASQVTAFRQGFEECVPLLSCFLFSCF